jgi:hypothetical protein
MYPLKQPFLSVFAFKSSFLIGREGYFTLISILCIWNKKHCPVTCPLISVPSDGSQRFSSLHAYPFEGLQSMATSTLKTALLCAICFSQPT